MELNELKQSYTKLTRYNELVHKISKRPHGITSGRRLTQDESVELGELNNYFAGFRVNEAGLMLVEKCIENLEQPKPHGLLDILLGRG